MDIWTSVLIGFFWFLLSMVVNLPWLIAFGNGHQARWKIFFLQVIPVFGWLIGIVWAFCGAGHIMRKTNWLCFRLWTYFFFFFCEATAVLLFAYGWQDSLP